MSDYSKEDCLKDMRERKDELLNLTINIEDAIMNDENTIEYVEDTFKLVCAIYECLNLDQAYIKFHIGILSNHKDKLQFIYMDINNTAELLEKHFK